MNNLFFAQLKKELFVAITERESVTGKCETLNNLLCEKIAAELSEKYYDLKIYHSEFGLCRSFCNSNKQLLFELCKKQIVHIYISCFVYLF